MLCGRCYLSSFLLLIQFVCCSNDLFGIRRTHAQRYFCRVVRDSAFLVISSEELDGFCMSLSRLRVSHSTGGPCPISRRRLQSRETVASVSRYKLAVGVKPKPANTIVHFLKLLVFDCCTAFGAAVAIKSLWDESKRASARFDCHMTELVAIIRSLHHLHLCKATFSWRRI